MLRTAILVDGAFYRKRAYTLFGEKTPEERASELKNYCDRHIKRCNKETKTILYRVLYYDCPPSSKNIYHPLLGKQISLAKSPLFHWTQLFFEELKKKRKFAMRMGRLSDEHASYVLKAGITKKLIAGTASLHELKEHDFALEISQKGVDMRLGIDIVTMAMKGQVDQIILISGDSDFVPAAKLARREGIDFILDPMRSTIHTSLLEHVDALRTEVPKPVENSETQP